MKKQVSLLLMAFMGVCLVLGGCGRSTSGTSVTETQTKAQAGTQTESQADAQTINQNSEKSLPGPGLRKRFRRSVLP